MTSRSTELHSIPLASLEELPQKHAAIMATIEATGFALIQGPDNSETTLTTIAKAIGIIQNHKMANDRGVVEVKPSKLEDIHQSQNLRNFFGSATDEFAPHTDGAFMDGYCIHEGRPIRINPPKLMLLQCVQPAHNGGESLLVDTQAVFQSLIDNNPNFLRILTNRSALSFCRGQQAAIEMPLFEQLSNGRWRVRFRYDAAYAKQWSLEAIQHVINDYFFNPKYQIRYKLEKGAILVLDNHRVLHGRAPIGPTQDDSNRELRRVWIWNDFEDYLVSLSDQPADFNAFESFSDYLPLTTQETGDLKNTYKFGIKVAAQAEEALANYLAQNFNRRRPRKARAV